MGCRMMDKNIRFSRDDVCLNIANSILVHDNELSRLSITQINKLIKAKSAEFGLNSIPKFSEIIRFFPGDNYYKRLLRIKPIKTQSGVAVVTVMPMPYDCPHGKCIYCPGGKEHNTPLSYIGTEPSTIIAQKLNFDPYEQVRIKVKQLIDRGHEVSKVELVIVGGTFPYYPIEYQITYVKRLFQALNFFNDPEDKDPKGLENKTNFSGASGLSTPLSVEDRVSELQAQYLIALGQSQLENQSSTIRCVGLTIETKPDYCKQEHIDIMLDLGTTRIELGVQTLSDPVFKMVNRGHSLSDVYQAFHAARNCGFKIGAHMMPGLPGSNISKDLEDIVTLFNDERLKPDMLKIYPTLVVPNTGLFELYQRQKYESYTTEELVKLLVEVKKIIPPWVRIMRIQREIEPNDIISGPKMGNIRQLVLEELKKQGIRCKCIRCREIGLLRKSIDIFDYEPRLSRMDYDASGGREVFLSYEIGEDNLLLGFLRMRLMANPLRDELKNAIDKRTILTDKNKTDLKPSNPLSAIVRELHVYGQVEGISNQKYVANSVSERSNDSPIGKTKFNQLGKENSDNLSRFKIQHKGLGRSLLFEAERICKEEFQIKALSVISAVGTKDYYRKFGYTNNGPYVTKSI